MRGLTLGWALTLALGSAVAAGGVLVCLLLQRWGESLRDGSERVREAASERAAAVVRQALGGAEASLARLQNEARAGVLPADDPSGVERLLLVELLHNPDLVEATFTRARVVGTDPEPLVAAGGRWQVSAWRDGGDAATVSTTRTRAGSGQDPTAHVTFRATLRHHRFSDEPLWTDLHYAERDEPLPEERRRVVVTVMGVVEDRAGRTLGVARLGLLASRLDAVTRVRASADDGPDPHRVFLADERGRLVTRLFPGQGLTDDGVDLRPATGSLPPEIRAALAQPALLEVDAEHLRRSARFEVDGRGFLLSAFHLPGARDWRIAVLAPEEHYLGRWRRTRRALLAASGIVVAALALAGGAGLRSVRLSLGGLVRSTARMRDFDFAPADARSPFRDLDQVLRDLEQAKTALRALGRYVPVDLVRQLYRSGREPKLGGEIRELTVLFTDIEGFTALAETLSPDRLARALGRYFEVMTSAVHASGGIVDKYIGDAVMALWNAPEPLPDHAARACAAALAGREATRRLMASAEWEGLPALRTRFGLHRGEVMVGHFGSPDRIAYTAVGDAVNLASRLEGQNRAYGTAILVSQAVREAAGDTFAFRLLDV
ncbi:MAG TPA: adenylate/guanylate cyclase domain-containing protein, partial [Vicinamibacteria bacterium]|nr:adenylate/guanylate cyclase domain-containing protein [Vicinamibacteria bacterium]